MTIYLNEVTRNSFEVTVVNSKKEFWSPVLASFVRSTDGSYFATYKGLSTRGSLKHCKDWFLKTFNHLFCKHGTIL